MEVSLNGNLADLGLPNIMQIICMSGKSGVLIIRSSRGEGRIILRDGLVRGAALENGPQDLQAILVDGDHVSKSEFDAAEADARSSGEDIEAILTERGLIDRETLQSACRESVESAVIQLFQWKSGEFTFDIRETAESGDPPPFASEGISPQYLAMEACRFADEGGGDENEGELGEDDAGCVESAFEPAPECEQADVVEPGIEPHADAGSVPAPATPATESVAEGELTSGRDAAAVAAPARSRRVPPAVVIDSDLRALEWIKESLADLFPRVHIFQRSDHALARIRQYLVRPEIPFVILSTGVLADPTTPVPNSAAFARRLKAVAPQMPIFWLEEDEAASLAVTTPNEGMARRPTRHQLLSEGSGPVCARLAGALHTAVEELLASGSACSRDGRKESGSDTSAQLLEEAAALLSSTSKSGEVLPLVIRLAARIFSRVAIFAVRDDIVVGIAQSGLDRADGPNDEVLQRLSLGTQEVAWFRAALSANGPVRAEPSDEGDRRLALLLGNRPPEEAYIAPIECAGRTVALLYGDNLPDGNPLGDTSTLETILNFAGLALDRRALERVLAEDKTDSAPAPQAG